MPRRSHTYLPSTLAATAALGAQIAAARRRLGWTAVDLAGRLGVTPALVARIERGAPATAIGTVLEAAVLCGVPLFDVDADDLTGVADRAGRELALLPRRVRPPAVEIDDDF